MAENSTHLLKQVEAAKLLKSQLKDIAGDDDDLIRDMIEGETSLHELMQAVVTDIGETTAIKNGLDEYIKTLTERKSKLEKRIDNFKRLLLIAMNAGEIEKKIEFPMATLSRKSVPDKLEIKDEADIPSAYWIRGNPILDKKKLMQDLKERRDQWLAMSEEERKSNSNYFIAGAELVDGGETTQIRWR